MADHFLMKGKVWSERKHMVRYPVAAEVKYDEIRLHVKRSESGIEFLSYDGNPLNNMDSWRNGFDAAMQRLGIFHLDMGVLVNKNFNDSYRWARTTTGTPKEKLDKKTGKVAPALFHHMVEFYLFDTPESRSIYSDRIGWHVNVGIYLRQEGIPTHHPKSVICYSEVEVDEAFTAFRAEGHEGAMVKGLDHTYECGKRIDGWLKMKPEAEADGKIIGFEEAISESGVPHGRAGSVLVELEDGSRAAPYGMDHDLARLMWENQNDYIGQWVMFRYMERDRAGGYRHPAFGRLRESK